MSEINQLERAKLAHKHGLRVEFKYNDSGNWRSAVSPTWANVPYRVHPDDEAKLDEIIWCGGYIYRYAYIDPDGFIFHSMLPVERHNFKLIATNELPTEESKVTVKSYPFAMTRAEMEVATGSKNMQVISNEEAELFEDCKRMLTELNKALDDGANVKVFSGCAYHEDIKALLERINPKPKLLPCPFCGSSTVNDTSEPTGGEDGVYQWVCPDCVACSPCGESLKQATELWNKRVTHESSNI